MWRFGGAAVVGGWAGGGGRVYDDETRIGQIASSRI